MDKFVHTVIEDSVLAMAEDEFVHFKAAHPVLGTYYERNVSFQELSSITGRLSALGLIRCLTIRPSGRAFRAPLNPALV
jgi:hypothetical protein